MREPPRALAYGVAVLATAASLFVRWPLWPVLGDAVPHMTFFPAVVVGAYFGGFWPGLLATVLSAVAANYFIIQYPSSFQVGSVNYVAALILFVLVGVIISGLNESLHRARRRIVADERRRAEEALSQERYLLHALMDNLPDNVYFKDTGGRFIRINMALTNCFGFNDPAEAVGKTDFDFFTEEHARPAFEDEQDLMRTGRPLVSKEEKETWADGRVRWVSTIKVPLRDPGGQIVGTLGISRDITERRNVEQPLRESEALYHSLVEYLPQNVFRKDLDGRVTFGNQRYCATLRRPLEEIIGKNDYDFFPAALAEKYRRDDAEVVRTGKPFETVEEHVAGDGTKLYVQVIKTPVYGARGEI